MHSGSELSPHGPGAGSTIPHGPEARTTQSTMFMAFYGSRSVSRNSQGTDNVIYDVLAKKLEVDRGLINQALLIIMNE